MAPIVDRLTKEFAGKVDVKVIDVDQQANQELVARFKINSIPTFAFIDRNGNVLELFIGGTSEETLRQKIQELEKK